MHRTNLFIYHTKLIFFEYISDMGKRAEMVDLSGQMGVPVIRIGDDLVVGFDEPKVKELLGV